MSSAPKSQVDREGVGAAGERGRRRALVVAPPSARRSELVEALRAAGFLVVVEGQADRVSDWVSDPGVDLVLLYLPAEGRAVLGTLGRVDVGRSARPRIVLVTGEDGVDRVVEEASNCLDAAGDVTGRESPDPARYDRLVQDARRRIMERDLGSASSCIEEAVDVDHRRPEALNLLGVVEEIRGARAEARVHWRIALILDPGYEPARENLRHATHRPRPPGGLALG